MNTDLKKELTELNSSLKDGEKHYFISKDVPTGYFEDMEDRFFESLREVETPHESKSIPLFKTSNFSYAFAAAACFAIVGLGLFNIIKRDSSPNISQNEVVNFLMDEGEIVASDNVTSINVNDLSRDEIKKFLSEVEGMDVSNIN